MAAEVLDAHDSSQFDRINDEAEGNLVVIHFWADWAPQCQQMTDAMIELAKDSKFIHSKFVKVEAEAVPEISERYNIAAVPTCIFVRNKHEIDRVNGANVPELTQKVERHGSHTSGTAAPPVAKEDLNTRLKKLINSAEVILFMKGNPEEPRCGFSRTVVGILNDQNVKYSTFNILADEEVRQGLKKLSDWPTYPQLYVKGEFVGGLDIIKELIESGEFESMVPKQKSLNERLKELINSHSVMLFMKGDPDTPRCGFSRTTIGILNESGIKYGTFDILKDEEIRQGLKTFSDWPTYPQLYVKGELIGGLDIIKELQESDELKNTLQGQ